MPLMYTDFQSDLRLDLAKLTSRVQQSLELGCEALLESHPRLAWQVGMIETHVLAEEADFERRAVGLMANQSLSEDDVREMTTLIKVGGELARISDCAGAIAGKVEQFSMGAKFRPSPELRALCHHVVEYLRQTILAFNLSDERASQRLVRGDDVCLALARQVVQDLLVQMNAPNDRSAKSDQGMAMISLSATRCLEQVMDHCQTISEYAVFLHTGQILHHSHVG